MSVILSKLKEVMYSVLPITLIVVLLNFTITPFETDVFIRFLVGAVLVIVGLTIFLIGVDVGIIPVGKTMGTGIVKTNKAWIVIVAGLVLGFFIAIAEPDLHIVAQQVDMVSAGLITKNSILITVSIGIAITLAIGLIRIVYNFPLNKMFVIIYGTIFFVSAFASPEFMAISFDAAAATTGALVVPFMLALAAGVSKLKKDSISSEEDSFGLVTIASTGAIITVMLLSIFSDTTEIVGSLESSEEIYLSVMSPFIQKLPVISFEVILALLPILILFLLFQKISFKLSRTKLRKILFGLLFTLIGLVLFLLGVNAGFMKVGTVIGFKLASMDSNVYIIVAAFVLGMVTILAEPAVYVLVHQIEEVTSGYVKKSVVIVTLAIGVALAVMGTVIKILVPQIQLWHFLLPGYVISIIMSFYVPKLFVGMAFDSGGVASGPMTATFVLAFAQGVAEAVDGANVLLDGFGVIAMVAMTPVIALQILGFIFKMKSRKEGINIDDK